MSAPDYLAPQEPPVDPLIGSVLAERYRIVRRLGEGGMGVVYEGEHVLIKRRVAIKTLHAQIARNAEAVIRFQREALAATAIGNEHIIEATDMGRLPDGSVFLVLEFLDGRDMADLLGKEGPLPVARAVHLVTQICEALQAAHDKGIVHRDLKPQNVYVIRRGTDHDFVKVLDFGISKFLNAEDNAGFALTRTGAAVGTPLYMSPEQTFGAKHVDHRTDIYAIGVILFQTLTGKCPFDAETFAGLVLKVASQPPPDVRGLRPDTPAALAALIDRTLAKEPAQRPQSCRELIQLLAPFATLDAAPMRGPPSLAAVSGVTLMQGPPPPAEPSMSVVAASLTATAAMPSGTLAPSPTRWIVAAGAALVLGIGATLAVVRPWQHAQPRDGSAPTAAPVPTVSGSAAPTRSSAAGSVTPTAEPPIRFSIFSRPIGAHLELDGVAISNPYHAEEPPSPRVRHIVATLAGHRTVFRDVTLLTAQDVVLDMHRGSGAEPRHATPSAQSPSTPPPASPSGAVAQQAVHPAAPPERPAVPPAPAPPSAPPPVAPPRPPPVVEGLPTPATQNVL